MEIVAQSDIENGGSLSTVSVEDVADSNCIKSWPVQLPVPVKAFYITGSRLIRRKPYRFKYSSMKNWFIPLDGPMSMDHIHFLLDCFVVSAGPGPLQLGRYHPQSDPEQFIRKNEEEEPKDNWSVNTDEEHDFWTKVGVANHKDISDTKDAGTSSLNPWSDDYTEPLEFGHRTSSLKVVTRPTFIYNELVTPDDVIARELSEMRLVLERLLDNHDIAEWEHPHELRNILDLLPEDITPKEPSPHYPVGDWEFDICGICFDTQWLYRRACCHFAACSTCLQKYFSSKIDDGQVKIECCNTTCNSYVHRDEVSAKLSVTDKDKFHRLLLLANQNSNTKTCPRCSHVVQISNKPKNSEQSFPCVTCRSCFLEWCFNCHAPWHEELSCKQFRKGDRLLRTWARERNHGQLNAQKCPKCKIFIQRTTGCDHMHCTRCMTDFCYKCGERFRYLKFFGDHYSKLSVFGCKYRFKADQPLQRKAIRGAIFGGKLVAAPLIGALAICAGALAFGISLFALPVYGGVRLYRHCEGRQSSKAVRRNIPTTKYLQNVSMQCRDMPRMRITRLLPEV